MLIVIESVLLLFAPVLFIKIYLYLLPAVRVFYFCKDPDKARDASGVFHSDTLFVADSLLKGSVCAESLFDPACIIPYRKPVVKRI